MKFLVLCVGVVGDFLMILRHYSMVLSFVENFWDLEYFCTKLVILVLNVGKTME